MSGPVTRRRDEVFDSLIGSMPELSADLGVTGFIGVTGFTGNVLRRRVSVRYNGGMVTENPFAVLSLIAAPAILTNASSVLAMSTSNRLARSVDRARELSKQLEGENDFSTPDAQRRLMELSAAERRAALLVSALQRLYVALGGFALAALVSLLGAVIAPMGFPALVLGLELAGVAAGLLAVGALVHGSATLVRETRIALFVLRERAAQIQNRVELFQSHGGAP